MINELTLKWNKNEQQTFEIYEIVCSQIVMII